jgi:dipeptidyl aminopeptidase/acylaminoacyl peptidase
MKFADKLKGNLLLVHGLIDDNVHPSNTWQLARKLQDADKRFDMMIYPGFKHGIGSTYNAIRWEYFYKHLRPEPSGDFDNQID